MSKFTVEGSKDIPTEFKRINIKKQVGIENKKNPQMSKNRVSKTLTLSKPKKKVTEEANDSHWSIKKTTLQYKGLLLS